ncbi:MAG: hypothetical protein JWL70_788, partial [Acidimicrobiia bacterium]|nr:hypothetical protein [Acidimicrobiia bacterium]
PILGRFVHRFGRFDAVDAGKDGAMADMITDLKDESIRTVWPDTTASTTGDDDATDEVTSPEGDDDGTDGDQDGTDGDQDGTDA